MRTNYVMCKFGICSSDIRNFLFHTYCTSYYGSPLWSLSQEYINKFYCAWRKCMEFIKSKVWNLPNQTHCVFLKHLYGDVNIDMQLLRRFASFYYCAMHSKNQIVSLCARCQLLSIVASNRKYLLYQLNNSGSTFEQSMNKLKNKLNSLNTFDNEICCISSVINELCLIRDGVLDADWPMIDT